MEKIIALDIGEKRIGVAISDALGFLAHPLKTLAWKNIEQLIADMENLAEEHQTSTFVIGLPYTLRGGHSDKTDEIKTIVDELKKHTGWTIIEVDERLTTVMAQKTLQNVGKKPSKHRDKIDQIAAVHILQTYLDGHSK